MSVEPYKFSDSRHRNQAMKEATEPLTGYASNGQKFSITHVNRHAPLKTIRFDSLWGDNATYYQQYIAVQHAAADQDGGYLSIELPAHGESDGLTTSQKKADDIISEISEAQTEAILNLETVSELDDNLAATGEAVGGLFARQFVIHAAHRGINVKNLFEFDPMGLQKRIPLGLALSHLAVAQFSRLGQRPAFAKEKQTLKDALFEDFIPEIASYGPTKGSNFADHARKVIKEPRILQFMLRSSSITSAVGLETLQDLLQANSELRAHFVFAGRSVVSHLTGTLAGQLNRLSIQSGGRVEFEEWPHESQNIGMAWNRPKLIKYMQDRI